MLSIEFFNRWNSGDVGSRRAFVPSPRSYLSHRCSASWFFSRSLVQNPFLATPTSLAGPVLLPHPAWSSLLPVVWFPLGAVSFPPPPADAGLLPQVPPPGAGDGGEAVAPTFPVQLQTESQFQLGADGVLLPHLYLSGTRPCPSVVILEVIFRQKASTFLAFSVLFSRLGSPRHWQGSRGFSVVVVVVVVLVVVGAGVGAAPVSVALLPTSVWLVAAAAPSAGVSSAFSGAAVVVVVTAAFSTAAVVVVVVAGSSWLLIPATP